VHWVAEKYVLRYFYCTIDYGLNYQRGDGVCLVGYIDLDWARCVNDMKSTLACCFGLGSTCVS
jgi:hypothetical protein